MSKVFVGYANVIETYKFFLTAQSQEDADGLIAMVNSGELSFEDLHKGDAKLTGLEVVIDEVLEVD